MQNNSENMKVFFSSLGCDKNLVDTEYMLALLAKEGFGFTDDETQADIIIVNTCCFIGDAKEESINTILELAGQKQTGRCRLLLVSGCLAQRYSKEIEAELPEVDAIIGTTAYDLLPQAISQALIGQKAEFILSPDRTVEVDRRILSTSGFYAFLKIAEGCDKCCTYCVIPKVRGRFRSIPMERLVKEAEDLASRGVVELILVAQETTVYGTDIYGHKTLPELLHRLCKIEGLHWIRLQYCYPEEITDELVDVIASEPKICHYLDIPIQNASDAVLHRMGRRTTHDEIHSRIASMRRRIPDLALRTTLIAGFPGETELDHKQNLAFVKEERFERLGVFTYSREENTAAALMDGQLEEDIKKSRRNELMEIQQDIAFEHSEEQVGRLLEVCIEGQVADENVYVGRTYMDAPNVDGLVFVSTDAQLMSGDFVKVRITGSDEYDLIGELADESAE